MKQLLITDRFLPHHGGSRVYYYEICNRMKIPVLTSPEKDSEEFDLLQKFPILRGWGIRPDYTGRFHPKNPLLNILINYIPPLLCMLFWGLLAVRRFKPKFIHAGGYQFAGFVAILMKRWFDIPFLIYAHGEEILAGKRSRFFIRYMRWVYRQADFIIANSEYTKSQLISIGVPSGSISIVPPGINSQFFESLPSCETILEKYNLENKKILLTVGRLTKRKGHEQVIRALPALIRETPDLHYLIAGVGSEMDFLRQLTDELNLMEHITFLGSVSTNELLQLYRVCDVFIMANRQCLSDIEGFGMVFLEAGAAGKPVIGGRSGGVVEAIQDQVTGFLINPEELDEITEKVTLLLKNQELQEQLGSSGQSWAKRFLWHFQVRKIASIINGMNS